MIVPAWQGTVYLRLGPDRFSRKIVGAHVHGRWPTPGCLAALAQAVRRAGPAARGGVHHSDHGSQYASDACQTALS